MKTIKKLLVVSILVAGGLSCDKDDNKESFKCVNNTGHVVGAQCKDGTRTSKTTADACNGHGGIEYGLCDTL